LSSHYENDTYTDWSERATKELKGKALDSLSWTSSTGLRMKPYYSAEELTRRYPVRFGREDQEWSIYESISIDASAEANKKALAALSAGASALHFVWSNPDLSQLPDLLKDIGMPYIECSFILPTTLYLEFAKALNHYLQIAGFELEACKGSIHTDLTRIQSGAELADVLEQVNAQSAAIHALLPGFRSITLDAAVFANAGLSAEKELGLALAWYQEIIHKEAVQLTLSSGREYYTELCKFRIALHLMHLVDEKASAPYLMAVSSETYLSELDRYSNVLRLSTSAMSAIIGGAAGIRLSAFSNNETDSESIVARITRNIQLVLLNETGMASVRDAAAGSYFLEEMSFMLSEQAWSYFIHIQDQGGFFAFIRSGKLEQEMENGQAQLLNDVKNRKRFFLGVNQYPSTLEKTPVLTEQAKGFMRPLHASRIFHAVKQSGHTKKAVLLKFGNLAMRNARAGFIDNFLRCGNWEIEEMVWEGGALPKANLYVLCASDEEYANLNLPSKSELASSGNKDLKFALAGAPGEHEAALRAQGVTRFIHARSPLYNTLKELEGLTHD